ncbi:hypothetical protein [Microbulbifer elongatus]|uniref:hypothetical protein n=1 Tax=Microbulbifer elongatus TaxID=86173 RepID=UPI001E3F4779|nr:hypothetical protein [Microbulbifer elongatus]
MRRALLITLLLIATPLLAQNSDAQGDKPVLESELKPAKATPGEAVTFRVTVLVPTFMPEPMEFPELDQPNLSITTPERSSVPISKQVNGGSWSGIMRDYRVQALAPGTYTLGGGSVKVTYMDPDTNTPIEVSLPIAPARLVVTVPPEAAGLKPFIAASDLTLEQTIDGHSEGIRAGDSFSRTVTATITGSTARQIPQILDDATVDGLSAYPQSPDAEDQGDTGTRVEKITYVAEGAARGKLPAVSIRWYDLDDQRVKTAELDAVPVSAKGAIPLSRMSLAQWLYLLAGIGLAALALYRWGLPWYRKQREEYLERKTLRPGATLEKLKRACRAQDYSALTSAVEEWRRRSGGQVDQLHAGLLAIGASRYAGTASEKTDAWNNMATIIHQLSQGSSVQITALPALNP